MYFKIINRFNWPNFYTVEKHDHSDIIWKWNLFDWGLNLDFIIGCDLILIKTPYKPFKKRLIGSQPFVLEKLLLETFHDLSSQSLLFSFFTFPVLFLQCLRLQRSHVPQGPHRKPLMAAIHLSSYTQTHTLLTLPQNSVCVSVTTVPSTEMHTHTLLDQVNRKYPGLLDGIDDKTMMI